MNKIILLFIAFTLPLFLVGCSDHVQLSGQVTYSDDGTPLEAGTVIFQTDTFQARGSIGAEGRYTLATLKEGDGLPPGKYTVYVNSAFRGELPPGAAFPVQIELITPKYASPDTSGLEVDVDRSTRTFDFQVDRAPGSKRE